jgi:hypothetical protein
MRRKLVRGSKRDQNDFQVWRDSDCLLDNWDALVSAAIQKISVTRSV